MLVMPKAEYVTWGGQRFEGSGVKPDVEVPWLPLDSKGDNQAMRHCNCWKRRRISAFGAALRITIVTLLELTTREFS